MSRRLRSARLWLLLATIPFLNAGLCTTIKEDRSRYCLIPEGRYCEYEAAGVVGYPCTCGEVRGRFGK